MTTIDIGMMMDDAARRFGFRRQEPQEPTAAYRHALAAHVDRFDFTAAHELRLGKPHASWTPEDIRAFRAHLETEVPNARTAYLPGTGHPFPIVGMPPGSEAATTENLLAISRAGLMKVMDRRQHQPDWDVPIFVSVLLTNGAILATQTTRGDRVALLKMLAQNAPVFGFHIVFDAYLHLIADAGRHEKRDVILTHIGTREMRIAMWAPYRRTPAGIVFDAIQEMDMRNANARDPYADVFVSVPPPVGKPS